MVLRPLLLALLLFMSFFASSAALAHKDHDRNQVVEAAPGPQPDQEKRLPARALAAASDKESEPAFTVARLFDWLGRLHPSIVHFPIAFFPAALFTALVGWRRPAFGEPVRFLIIAGGLTAPLAMLLGWLDGGWRLVDRDEVLLVHRWLGTAIGVGGLGLALWTLARPASVRGTAMLVALSVVTAAVVVQGWHGGALVHGVDHLNW